MVRVIRRGRLGFWSRLVVAILYPLVAVMFKLRWRGLDNIPRRGGVIVVANHVSYVDPLGLAKFVWDSGRYPSFLAKDSLFRIPVVGRILGWANQIPVYRGTADARDSLRDAVRALENGACLVIYPEGTVTRDPDWWPMLAKTGVARVALAADVPVIPVAQWGAQFAYDRYNHKRDFLPRKPLTNVAGPPIDLSAYRGRPVTAPLLREVTDVCMAAVRDLLGELRELTPPDGFAPRPSEQRREPS